MPGRIAISLERDEGDTGDQGPAERTDRGSRTGGALSLGMTVVMQCHAPDFHRLTTLFELRGAVSRADRAKIFEYPLVRMSNHGNPSRNTLDTKGLCP